MMKHKPKTTSLTSLLTLECPNVIPNKGMSVRSISGVVAGLRGGKRKSLPGQSYWQNYNELESQYDLVNS